MFTQLDLKNFRGFENLQLKGLQRVNLIVGRNNAGKTSLLEGIVVIANPADMQSMPGLLRTKAGQANERYFRWLMRNHEGVKMASLESSGGEWGRTVRLVPTASKDDPSLAVGFTHVANAGGLQVYIPPVGPRNKLPPLDCGVISVEHRSSEELVKMYAAAVKHKDGEERIENLLREVDDRVRKIRVYPSDDGNHIMVDLQLPEMIPVTQVGQGMNRLIAIFSELIGKQPDICIIDEIENGIHHSMLEQVWAGLAVAAERLNIQIFATTHSHECIEAAHKAFVNRQAYDFSIIQLFRVEGAVQGRVLDRKHIEAALAGEIDIR